MTLVALPSSLMFILFVQGKKLYLISMLYHTLFLSLCRFLSIIHNCQIRLANSEYVKSHKSFKIFLESIITRASIGIEPVYLSRCTLIHWLLFFFIGLSVLTTFIDYGNISGLAKARGPIPFIPEASISESKVGERFEWMKGMVCSSLLIM